MRVVDKVQGYGVCTRVWICFAILIASTSCDSFEAISTTFSEKTIQSYYFLCYYAVHTYNHSFYLRTFFFESIGMNDTFHSLYPKTPFSLIPFHKFCPLKMFLMFIRNKNAEKESK